MARLTNSLKNGMRDYWRASRWHKIWLGLAAVLVLWVGIMYGIAQWYIHTEANKPEKVGVSFIPYYAESLGVDPQQAMDGLLDIGVRHFRLVSYWNAGEPQPGQYDFSTLDWQFKKAEQAHAKVSLSLGLRQPRWPECHLPDWARQQSQQQWQTELQQYIQAVIERYKDSPALDSYQLENEYFLKGFGNCEEIPGAMDRQRLIAEYNIVS